MEIIPPGFTTLSALLFFAGILLLPVIFGELRNSKSVLLGYWFVVGIHEIVPIINALFFETLGAGADAKMFHRIASELATSSNFSFGIGAAFYENLLGITYWVWGTSELLGGQVSILAFAISCTVLLKLLRLLELSEYQTIILVVYGSLPSMIMFGSVTLRESYQILFFMLAVYSGIKMLRMGGINTQLITLVAFALLMGLFHPGLIVYSFLLIGLFLTWRTRPLSGTWNVSKLRLLSILAIPMVIGTVLALSAVKLPGLQGLAALANLSMLDAAANYREVSLATRATYGTILDVSTTSSAFYSSLLVYLHYLFAPFPWNVRNLLDLYATAEAFLRMLLLYASFRSWNKAVGVQRNLFGLMLILFLSMSFLWAMGTSNYGTAIRHHLVSWWIIVVLGLPFLIDKLSLNRSMLVAKKGPLGQKVSMLAP